MVDRQGDAGAPGDAVVDPETELERRKAAVLVLVALVFMAVLVGSVGPVGYQRPAPPDDLRAGQGS